MKAKSGLSYGIGFTLVVGVFAAMVALGMLFTFSTPGPVGADHGTDLDPALISVRHNPAGVGDPAKVTVKFTAVP